MALSDWSEYIGELAKDGAVVRWPKFDLEGREYIRPPLTQIRLDASHFCVYNNPGSPPEARLKELQEFLSASEHKSKSGN